MTLQEESDAFKVLQLADDNYAKELDTLLSCRCGKVEMLKAKVDHRLKELNAARKAHEAAVQIRKEN